VTYDLEGSEKGSIVFRRSLYAVAPIARGAAITDKSVRSIRPGYGLPPKHLPQVLSMIATRDIEAGEPLSWDLLTKKG